MAAEPSRIEAIFNDAVELTAPAERAAFLDRTCSDNVELRQRVDALLAANDTADVLQMPYSDRRLEASPVVSERPGAKIGRYKLLEQIGEGGFGVVFMAEQLAPIRRKVALKVIKPGVDTKQVIARFEAERQALALMDHENIAKVLDAGATDSGRPFFVMELVHGVPITEYCDKSELAARERLELFVKVCRAVQHAHTKGVIHRDIKPTNVLVTLNEGVAVPKVIDFGIAKATGQQLTEKTLFTNFAQMVGTPLYMSPEQAEMTGIDVDTRSDIYSLGALLYELLTGTTPLDKERMKQAAFDEVRRIIREEEPPRPSTRLSTMGEQAQRTISAQRKSDPKHLGRLVRGELDWIVMKAMEKERARRYETANGLARDVERYLRDEPVEACPPSGVYRMRKFARRNRVAVITALAVVAGLMLVVTGLVISNRVITASRNKEAEARRQKEQALVEAEAHRRRAEENFLKARVAVRDLLMSPVLGGSQWDQLPAPLRKQFAEMAINYYASLLQGDGADLSQRYETAVGQRALGYLYEATGDLKRANGLLRQSIQTFESLHRESPRNEEYRQQLAWSHYLLCRNLWGRDPEAEVAAKRSFDFYDGLVAEQAVIDQPAVEAMMVYYRIGELFETAGQHDEAERAFQRAIAVHEQRTARVPSDPRDPDICHFVAQWDFALAGKRVAAGRMEDAADLYTRGLKIDPDHHEKWCEAAGLYLSIGDVERYRGVCRELLDRFEKLAEERPEIAERTAKTCALAAESVPDWSRVEHVAQRSVTGTQGHGYRRYFVLAKGLAEHRAGRQDQAIEWLQDFAPRVKGTHVDATAFAALAMAHHRLGHADAARAALDSTRAIIAKKPADAMKGPWLEWLHCEIFCREAEQLLAR